MGHEIVHTRTVHEWVRQKKFVLFLLWQQYVYTMATHNTITHILHQQAHACLVAMLCLPKDTQPAYAICFYTMNVRDACCTHFALVPCGTSH